MSNALATRPQAGLPTTWTAQAQSWWNRLAPAQRIAVGCLALMMFAAVIALFFMPARSTSGVDVVNGVAPVSTQFADDAHSALNELRTMAPADRANYINTRYPNIGRNIAMALRDAGKLAPGQTIGRIEYRYGSMEGVVAETANGGTARGHFKDQLLALVYPTGSSTPVVMLVLCSNGLVEFPAGALNQLQTVGGQDGAAMAFTIERGWGINHYVDYPTSIRLARYHHLPIRKKEGGSWQTITPAQALALESQTDRVRVVVQVYPGDRFDPATMSYTSAR